MNLFDDRRAQPDDSAGENSVQSSSKARIDLLLKVLTARYGTEKKVAEKLGVNRSTVRLWREIGRPDSAIGRLELAVARDDAREETQGDGYTLHGEADEAPPIRNLKLLVNKALRLRKVAGLKHDADDLDRLAIAMVEEQTEAHPSRLEGKFLAVKAAALTGLGQIDAAIETFKAAAEAMREHKNEMDAYRYTISLYFLEIKRAFATRTPKTAGALRELLGRAQQVAQDNPKTVSNAVSAQRIGVLLTILSMSNDKDGFIQEIRSIFNDFVERVCVEEAPAGPVSRVKPILLCHALYGGVEKAKTAIRQIVVDNDDGCFDAAIKGNWLAVLRTIS
ncbi:MAG: hypothetical protein H7255_05195 [Ramlibacter sp.]|nr:hypothetical protein [Ramlibacter sp.]